MSKYCVTQDVKRCIGCKACEIHCKIKNNVPDGSFYCKMIEVGPELVNGVPVTDFIYAACFHCGKPKCVAACPTGAMQRREKDGIVFVDSELCEGCKDCITGCPWEVPQWNDKTGKVEKCDLCMDRIDQGLEPACVSKCTTSCLKLEILDAGSTAKRQLHAKKLLKPKRKKS